jgi:hypothetical protein
MLKSLFKNGQNKIFDLIIYSKEKEEIHAHKCILMSIFNYFKSMYKLMDKSIQNPEFHLDFSKTTILFVLNISYDETYIYPDYNLEINLEILTLFDFLGPKFDITKIINLINKKILIQDSYHNILIKTDTLNMQYFNSLINLIIFSNKTEIKFEMIKLLDEQESKLSQLSENKIKIITKLLLPTNSKTTNIRQYCDEKKLNIFITEVEKFGDYVNFKIELSPNKYSTHTLYRNTYIINKYYGTQLAEFIIDLIN